MVKISGKMSQIMYKSFLRDLKMSSLLLSLEPQPYQFYEVRSNFFKLLKETTIINSVLMKHSGIIILNNKNVIIGTLFKFNMYQ